MTIAEKVAYIKGLYEGLELDKEKSGEARMLGSMLEVLEQISTALEDISDKFDAMGDEIDALSDGLSDVEEMVFNEDEDDDEDEDFFEIECPNCGEPLCIDENVLEEGVVQCPGCERKFVLDLSDDDGGCGCGCCCEDDEPSGKASEDEEDLSF